MKKMWHLESLQRCFIWVRDSFAVSLNRRWGWRQSNTSIIIGLEYRVTVFASRIRQSVRLQLAAATTISAILTEPFENICTAHRESIRNGRWDWFFEQNKLAKTRIISDFAQKQTENWWKWKKCFVIIVSNKKS